MSAASSVQVKPLPKESIDSHLAGAYLLLKLTEIPEFAKLWEDARRNVEKAFKAMRPELEKVFSRLYDKDARKEAARALVELRVLTTAMNKVLQKHGLQGDYEKRLSSLIEPLLVPGLLDLMKTQDAMRWNLTQLVDGPIEGPMKNQMESEFIKFFTDYSPLEAAKETPGRFRDRMQRKTAPVRLHLNKFDIAKRIDLWIENRVLGQTIQEIADEIGGRLDNRPRPYEWEKNQIRQANEMLETTQRRGRPRNGGATGVEISR